MSAVRPCAEMYSRIFGRAVTVSSVGCIRIISPAFKLFVARSNIRFASWSRQSIVSLVHIITLYPMSLQTMNMFSPILPLGGANSFEFL